MSDKVKDINIKVRIYYFFNYTINTENSDPNNIMKSQTKIILFAILDMWQSKNTQKAMV